jgi:hypothetical protein
MLSLAQILGLLWFDMGMIWVWFGFEMGLKMGRIRRV